ncbi:unnamed protein product [Angiostrongylus costaricensis]|uniref:Transmembrane protein 256 homolog n=1 Tax=Angiostrongylus costaricensis TaxID=334426 RepID=A0A0R3PW93_ANGCS|nr:unnamed protein product [Angiostrongylus costaricensis]
MISFFGSLLFPGVLMSTSPGIHHPSSSCTAMSPIIRIAGLSGAVAVALAAYGSHKIGNDMTIDVRRKKAFETASLHHIVHTLAILAAPKARYPYLTSAVFLSGIIMFCGPCYHYSIAGQESTRKFTPIGGVMFILGWITFIL